MQLSWNDPERLAAERLIELALEEDLGQAGDLTTAALIAEQAAGTVQIVARVPGVLAGSPIIELVFRRIDPRVKCVAHLSDGAAVVKGTIVADLSGPLRSLLTGERTVLNFLTHLSGVASLTRQYVAAVHRGAV